MKYSELSVNYGTMRFTDKHPLLASSPTQAEYFWWLSKERFDAGMSQPCGSNARSLGLGFANRQSHAVSSLQVGCYTGRHDPNAHLCWPRQALLGFDAGNKGPPSSSGQTGTHQAATAGHAAIVKTWVQQLGDMLCCSSLWTYYSCCRRSLTLTELHG